MDERARRQLDILRQIDFILSQQHVRFWLRGGWALDFLLGRITRSHADLDLVVWQRHRERIQHVLGEAGYRLDRELPVQSDFVKDGQDVTLVFIERSPSGSIAGHGTPEWTWQSDALPDHRYCLHGTCARVVAPHQMVHDQEGYEAATGQPPRPKDLETIKTLQAIMRSQ